MVKEATIGMVIRLVNREDAKINYRGFGWKVEGERHCKTMRSKDGSKISKRINSQNDNAYNFFIFYPLKWSLTWIFIGFRIKI